MEAKYGQVEITALLYKVRIFDKNIGTYQRYAITDTFNYAVKLTNGTIVLSWKDLQDDEKDALTPVQLKQIAGRFIPDEKETTMNATNPVTPPEKAIIKKKSNVARNILKLIGIIALVLGILALIDNLKHKPNGESYESKVMTVKETEEAFPARFLNASGTYNESFWGNNMNIHGTVVNKATVANYKDILVEVIFYSSMETELNRLQYKIYDFFPAHSTKEFELKIERPADCKKLGWDVVNATPY